MDNIQAIVDENVHESENWQGTNHTIEKEFIKQSIQVELRMLLACLNLKNLIFNAGFMYKLYK